MTATLPVVPSGDGAHITPQQALIVKAEAAAQKRLIAERNKEKASKLSETAREEVISSFKAAGITELPVDNEGITVVEMTKNVIDEDAIEAYVKRYASEHYDAVFVPSRSFNIDALRALVSQGKIGKKATSHIKNVPSTPQVRRYNVR